MLICLRTLISKKKSRLLPTFFLSKVIYESNTYAMDSRRKRRFKTNSIHFHYGQNKYKCKIQKDSIYEIGWFLFDFWSSEYVVSITQNDCSLNSAVDVVVIVELIYICVDNELAMYCIFASCWYCICIIFCCCIRFAFANDAIRSIL